MKHQPSHLVLMRVRSMRMNCAAAQVVYTATADDSGDISSGGVTFNLSDDSDSAFSD